jgi:hypothetical protein
VQTHSQVALEGIWPVNHQRPANFDGLVARGQRFLAPPQLGESIAEIS